MPEPQQPDARSAPLLDPENAVRCDTEGEAASGPSPQASEAPPPATKGSGSAALVFVLWNTMMGSTLLVMPSCFRESGWLLGLVLAVLCAGVSQYTCGVVLLHGMRLPDPQAEVADLAHAYLGRYGWGATLFASVGVCFGAACAMHGYLATSLNDLLVDSREQGGLGLASAWTSLSPNPKGVAAALVLALLLPLCSLRSMALLARLNGVGIACLFLILAFIGASAVANGLAPEALAPASLAQPSLKVLGTLALSFFIHSIAITIFRAAATPAHNARNLGAAYALVLLTYVSVGVSANLCPPLGDPASLESAAARNSFLSVRQPPSLATPLLVARFAVVLQCVTVYPVLVYAIRTQTFCALVYRDPYPGALPVLGLNAIVLCATAAVSIFGLHIADVLRFTGAFAALVMVYAVPAGVQWAELAAAARSSRRARAARLALTGGLLCCGCLTVAVQFE